MVPLIVHLHADKLDKGSLQAFGGRLVHYDFFSYAKAHALVYAGALSLFFLIALKPIQFRKGPRLVCYLLLALYGSGVLVSTMLSENWQVALGGFVDHYEGASVLFSYIIIALAAARFIENRRQLSNLLLFFIGSANIIALIGFTQAVGFDLFQTDFGRWLVTLGTDYADSREKIGLALEDQAIYATLHNPNFVGSFAALAMPVHWAFLQRALQLKRWRIVAILANLAMLLMLLGSGSRAGFVAVAAALFCWFFLLKERFNLSRRQLTVSITTVVIMVIVLLSILLFRYEDSHYVEEVSWQNNRIYLKIDGHELYIKNSDQGLTFFDHNLQVIETEKLYHLITLKDERYAGYQVSLKANQRIFDLRFGKKLLKVLRKRDGRLEVVGSVSNTNTIEKPESWFFNGYERLGTGRGFIYSRSLPLLKKTLLWGFGPDNFVFHFPQRDVAGQLNAFRHFARLVDKPHNLYLQVALNTGLPSALALIFLLIFLLKRSFNENLTVWQAALVAAISGYAIAGLFNDSVVSVAPIFWVFTGCAIAGLKK